MALALLQSAPAFAQDSDREAVEAADEADDDNVIVVTGTGTNISGVAPVGSEAITIGREEIIASGKTTAADVVRTLPQVRNLGDFREGGTQGSANSQQGNAINLHGLGAEATLVLVDGHRVVGTGAASIFTEANQVPLAGRCCREPRSSTCSTGPTSRSNGAAAARSGATGTASTRRCSPTTSARTTTSARSTR